MKVSEFPLAGITVPYKYRLSGKRRNSEEAGGAHKRKCLDDSKTVLPGSTGTVSVIEMSTNTPNETEIEKETLDQSLVNSISQSMHEITPDNVGTGIISSDLNSMEQHNNSVNSKGKNSDAVCAATGTIRGIVTTTETATGSAGGAGNPMDVSSANPSSKNPNNNSGGGNENAISVMESVGESAVLDDGALPLSPIASTPGEGSPILKPLNMLEDVKKEEKIETERLMSIIKSKLGDVNVNHLIYSLLSTLHRSELSDISTLLRDNLKRDFITSLPLEISMKILNKLPFDSIHNCMQVSKSWNTLINGTPALWKHLLLSESFVSKDIFDRRYPVENNVLLPPNDNDSRYRKDFLENCRILQNWYNPNFIPQRTTLKGHMTSVVTCLQFEDNYVITGADDKMIRVYDSVTKKFLLELSGHDGGVWALKYAGNGILVSGSTDRSVRIWNIELGKCTHVFKGHTSTVRCLDIVEYEGVKYIVTGSRDNTLHIWKLPPTSVNVNENMPNIYNSNGPLFYHSPDENPYFVGVLRGHIASVRTVSGHGRIVISGSYDNNLIVWDIIQMKCLYILMGHSDRIYSTIYDHKRNRCISASMDSTIKIWDLQNIWNNGECVNVTNAAVPCTKICGPMTTLQGHTALVGLLKLSDKFLVSAAADGSLRGWDSVDYSRKFAYHHNNLSAITTFYMTDNILVSGSEGQFNIYNLRTGKLIHSNILSDADQIWSVNFKGSVLVAAVEKDGQSFVEILDFSKQGQSLPPAIHENLSGSSISNSSLLSSHQSEYSNSRPHSTDSAYTISSNAIASSSE
ncbi:Cell division control protein 4 [Nakaseomyces bracarensis]|uniref:Cell division control protein 4 n=1 Tax=Nakaseomyces bracarensis TaxID=273131 RepID=A0ABR4NXM7_9SACH